MKPKIIVTTLFALLALVACAPQVVATELVIDSPTSTPIPPPTTTGTPTQTPTHTQIPFTPSIAATATLLPLTDSNLVLFFNGKAIWCALGFSPSTPNYLQVIPNSCHIVWEQNQQLPQFFHGIHWAQVQSADRPLSLEQLSASVNFDGHDWQPAMVRPPNDPKKRNEDYLGLTVSGDQGAHNFAVVMIKNGDYAGKYVLIDLVSRGPVPTPYPAIEPTKPKGSGGGGDNNDISTPTPGWTPPPPPATTPIE